MRSAAAGKRLIPSFLTISQLAVAIIFIMLGFTVSYQIEHILNIDTGINRDQAIIIEAPVVKPKSYATLLASLKQEISTISNVSSVATSSFLVNKVGGGVLNVKRIGSDVHFGMDFNSIDEDFIPFYDLKILAGRNFIKDDMPDAVIISRFAASRFGFNDPEEAVGAKISLDFMENRNWQDAEVIGVFENFRNFSFLNMSQSSTESTTDGRGIVFMFKGQSSEKSYLVHDKISVRVSPQNPRETIGMIQNNLNSFFRICFLPGIFLTRK